MILNGSPNDPHGGEFDGPALYRIRVSGRLSERWRDRVGGLEMVIREDENQPPQTELMGPLPDQAALMGVLEHLYARGVAIVRVERVTDGTETDP